jgi:hypothetical protein
MDALPSVAHFAPPGTQLLDAQRKPVAQSASAVQLVLHLSVSQT